MVTREFTLPNFFNELKNDPFLVGFDHFFDRVGSRFDGVGSRVAGTAQATSYPPYNIVKNSEDNFAIEIALAGYSENDVQVEVKEDTLSVSCGKLDYNKDEARSYIHRGIAKRSFERKWTLSPTVVVTGASFVNGLLSISLQNEIPESQKPRTIVINGDAGSPEFLTEAS